MKVAIHQPEHFPYLGYFQKMEKADLFIILDDVKFKKNNFQNRNRFLNKSGKEEWFTLPVEKKANSKLIKDVKIGQDFGWKKKIIKQININFGLDLDILNNIYNSDSLCISNLRSIDYCRLNLNIQTPYIMSSDLNIKASKSDLLVKLCKEVNATHYISGSGGTEYLDMNLFVSNKIHIEIFNPKLKDYYTALCHI